jgi:riboflavin-specific deaminase-like protein
MIGRVGMGQTILDWTKNEIQNFQLTKAGRPVVTLSYAQGLDGSISVEKTLQTRLSCDESMFLTHNLRSIHDGILVGIGTILADNPRLTARLSEGKNPTPIILDSELKMPFDARLLSEPPYPIIFHSSDTLVDKRKSFTEKGCLLLECEKNESGKLKLDLILTKLLQHNIRSVMVEGGAEVLTDFLRLGLWDFAVITISPKWLGGYRCTTHPFTPNNEHAEMEIFMLEKLGSDAVLAGKRKT